MAEINWTRESEIWLRDIYSYIAADNPHAAALTVTRIYEKTQLLKKHPRLGHPYEPEQTREVRILLYEHYRIAYLIRPDGNIDISRRLSWRFRYRTLLFVAQAFYSPMIFTSTRLRRPPSNSP